MGISVTISEAAKARADALVLSGRYDSVDEAVEAGLRRLEDYEEDVEVDLDDLPPEHRAAVERGLADAEAGRLVDGEQFLSRLIAKYEAMAKVG